MIIKMASLKKGSDEQMGGGPLVVLVVIRGRVILAAGLVDLAMSPQVGDDGEVSAAAFDVTGEWLLAGMAVHVRLEGAGAGEALVANLALVLLLRARRDLGAELTHHRLRRRRHGSSEERTGSGQCP